VKKSTTDTPRLCMYEFSKLLYLRVLVSLPVCKLGLHVAPLHQSCRSSVQPSGKPLRN
jgi:hypothetical protein